MMIVFHVLRISMLLLDVLLLLGKSLWAVLSACVRKFAPARRKSLHQQVILVTGAAQGLGKALATRCAKLGGTLVLWDINKEVNEQVAAEIRQAGGQAWAYQCDVADERMVKQVADKVRHEVGDVTILINNAAVAHVAPLTKLTDQQINTLLRVNLLGHFWTVREFLPRMQALGVGHVIAIASTAGITGYAYLTSYSASKFGVVGFMASLQEELRMAHQDSFIHLTTICPVAINTGLTVAKTRFPAIVPVLEVDYAADRIVDAILRNETFVVIPHRFHFILNIVRFFPVRIGQLVADFLEYGAEPAYDQ